MSDTSRCGAVGHPGPYEADIEDVEPGDSVAIMIQGAVIATVHGSDEFPCFDPEEQDIDAVHAETLATARLLAAAPDLLDALRDLFAAVKNDNRGLSAAWDKSEAAISKATGGTP